jgi:carotenoid cleavage dioxygenase
MYYEGHGMLHAVYFNKSSLGEWKISYRNKYVNSDTFQLESNKNQVAFVPSADGQPYATLVAFLLNIVSLMELDSKINNKGSIQF